MRFRSFLTACVLAATLGLPLTTQAGSHRPLLLAEVSASQAGAMAAKRTGGKVLKVSEGEQGGRRVYRVKVLLPEGRVTTVIIGRDNGSKGG